MNAREFQICRTILDVLNAFDGMQVNETILHAETNLRIRPNATLGEFEDAVGFCDRSGWLIGVVGKFGKGKKWNISDAGKAARLEMQRE